MSPMRRCSRCGVPLDPLDPERQCAACLLKLALEPHRAAQQRTSIASLDETTTGSTGPRDVPLLARGQRFGPYLIVGFLGAGGMGQVYEAESLENGRRLALKVLIRPLVSDADRRRFLTEGRLAASISHPNTVYVFGTEDIAGIPVIAMELVRGGTLKDRVGNEGPLTVTEAVRAIRDVIAGLSAAADCGILHRDVKPSNCFVAEGGQVKIGDFGLSLQSEGREDSRTEPGVLLGTPAFCSPEQLKGERLDVRADIYSVGASMFYLLTGQPPFADTNLLSLITKTLEEQPPLLHDIRPDVPSLLNDVVRRCLEKEPSDRFGSYDELLEALRPLTPGAARPADIPVRVVAGFTDLLILAALWLPADAVVYSLSSELSKLQEWLVCAVINVAIAVGYFALLEWWRGASFGKLACGLSVVPTDQLRTSGSLAAARALIFMLGLYMAPLAVVLSKPPAPPGDIWQSDGTIVFSRIARSPLPGTLVSLCGLLLLFSTARRGNGYRGIHEVITKTRTVHRVCREGRELIRSHTGPVDPTGPLVGPYLLESPEPERQSSLHVLNAYDAKLRRRVWIVRHPPGATPVTAARRDIDRPTRVRWLAGRHANGEHWDAYERPDGRPFTDVVSTPQSYQAVKTWLQQLARELGAAREEGTLDRLGLGRLWMTTTGDVKILDWDAHQNAGDDLWSLDVTAGQHFLARVAETALACSRKPPPLHLCELVRDLRSGRYEDYAPVIAACDKAAAKESEILRLRRAAPVIAATIISAIPLGYAASRTPREQSDALRNLRGGLLAICLQEVWRIEQGMTADTDGRKRRAVQMCVAAVSKWVEPHTRARWESARESRPILEAALAAFPSAEMEDLIAVQSELPRQWTDLKSEVDDPHVWRVRAEPFRPFRALYNGTAILSNIAIAAVLTAVALGRNWFLRLLGIVVVTAQGAKASRWRTGSRTLVVFLPLIVWRFVHAFIDDASGPAYGLEVLAPLGMMALGASCALIWPARGFPEMVTRTWLVRR